MVKWDGVHVTILPLFMVKWDMEINEQYNFLGFVKGFVMETLPILHASLRASHVARYCAGDTSHSVLKSRLKGNCEYLWLWRHAN
jgi:hypothetical protein